MVKTNGNRFSVYTSEEKTVLGVINELANELSQGNSQVNLELEVINRELEEKTDLWGDHKGTWQGLNRPTMSDEGMKATVEDIIDNKIPTIQSSLDNMKNNYKVLDFDYGDYKKGQLIGVDYLRTRQSILYGQFFQKLRKGENVTINCQGDSLTYGHDTVSSDKRSADTTPCPDGSSHTYTRASKTYPEALSECLNLIFNNKVTVINRGFSGDGCERSYKRWITPTSANVTIINLGTNDSRETWITNYGDIENYINWYEKLIVREIIWGKAVIILTPPKQKTPTTIDVDVFSNALYLLGLKYNIPVITVDEMLANYDSTIYSDDTHLNGKGYEIYGKKLSAIFIGENNINKNLISGGSNLACRPTIDNIVPFGNFVYQNTSGGHSPDEGIDNSAFTIRCNEGGGVVYSFYTETDNIIAIPTIYVSQNSKFDVELDFNAIQPDYTLDSSVGRQPTFTNIESSNINFTTNNNDLINSSLNEYKYIHIVRKGWHTLKLTCKEGSCVVNGVEFKDYKIKQLENSIKINTHYKGSTHTTYSDTTDITETRISYDIIKNNLGINEIDQYWKGIPLKIKIHNYDKSVLEYTFLFCSKNSTMGWKLNTTPVRFNLTLDPSAEERTLTALSFDNNSKELVFTWGGKTTRASVYVISF